MRPGWSVLSVTPLPANCFASTLKPTTMPGRWALESCSALIGSCTALDWTATTRPQPRSAICGSRRPRIVIGASTSVRCAASHCSRVKASGSGFGGGPPVLAM